MASGRSDGLTALSRDAQLSVQRPLIGHRRLQF